MKGANDEVAGGPETKGRVQDGERGKTGSGREKNKSDRGQIELKENPYWEFQ